MKLRQAWMVALLLVLSTANGQPVEPSQQSTKTTSSDTATAERAAQRKAARAAARAAAERAAAEKAATEKAAQERAAAEKLAADHAAVAARQTVEHKAAAEKAAAERAMAAAKTAAENAVAERRLIRNLLLATTAFSFMSLVLLVRALFRRMPAPQMSPEHDIARRLDLIGAKIDAFAQSTDHGLQKLDGDLAENRAGTSVWRSEFASALSGGLGRLSVQIARIAESIERSPASSAPQSETDLVALERKVLGESYKAFCANGELSGAVESAVRENTWIPLIDNLAKFIPKDLKPTFDAVVAPCKEHWNLVQKIAIVVPRAISGTAGELPIPEEIRRAREFTTVLQDALGNGASRLNFPFKNWVTDTFLPFADLYLQRHQQARADDRNDDLQRGANLVRQLLRIAAVEPIDVLPGQTRFDSTRHIGRSTTNDPRYADGVITGVVRNGFIEEGQLVIRQPEVIVNRMR